MKLWWYGLGDISLTLLNPDSMIVADCSRLSNFYMNQLVSFTKKITVSDMIQLFCRSLVSTIGDNTSFVFLWNESLSVQVIVQYVGPWGPVAFSLLGVFRICKMIGEDIF